MRNGRILRHYIRARSLPQSEWLVLHEELEEEHYRDAIRPVLMRYAKEPVRVDELMKSVRRGIERHVQYFDQMLQEYRAVESFR